MDDEQIYRQNHLDLIRYAAALVGPTAADDVVATVVVRVLARRRLVDLAEPRAYLFRAVLNECRSHTARNSPGRTLINDSEPSQVADCAPEVLTAVLGLPTRQRAATYLFYWADMSITDTAHLMGIREGTAKRYLHLARRALKGVLHER